MNIIKGKLDLMEKKESLIEDQLKIVKERKRKMIEKKDLPSKVNKKDIVFQLPNKVQEE